MAISCVPVAVVEKYINADDKEHLFNLINVFIFNFNKCPYTVLDISNIYIYIYIKSIPVDQHATGRFVFDKCNTYRNTMINFCDYTSVSSVTQ